MREKPELNMNDEEKLTHFKKVEPPPYGAEPQTPTYEAEPQSGSYGDRMGSLRHMGNRVKLVCFEHRNDENGFWSFHRNTV